MSNQQTLTYLEQLHTKQLLDLKRTVYRLSYPYKMVNGVQVRDVQQGGVFYPWPNSNIAVTLEDIKHVLSNRPHIPNSKEAKTLRQERACFNKKPLKTMKY